MDWKWVRRSSEATRVSKHNKHKASKCFFNVQSFTFHRNHQHLLTHSSSCSDLFLFNVVEAADAVDAVDCQNATHTKMESSILTQIHSHSFAR